MALEREWLTDQARRERDAMGRSVQYTEAEYWDKDSVLPGWLNRDLIAHLAGRRRRGGRPGRVATRPSRSTSTGRA